MMKQFAPTKLPDAISHAIEECGELAAALGKFVQACGKTQRFGYDSVNPFTNSLETNLDWLLREMNDITAEANDVMIALGRVRQLAKERRDTEYVMTGRARLVVPKDGTDAFAGSDRQPFSVYQQETPGPKLIEPPVPPIDYTSDPPHFERGWKPD
jgi:hypothetical protein